MRLTYLMTSSLCLVAIFKNEGHILQEWIHHYLKQGVDKIFLVDNASNDNYLEQIKIQEYLNKNLIEISVETTNGKQAEAYNTHYLSKCKAFTWTMVCDLDEFIYARNGFLTIKDYLNSLNTTVDQVFVPWKMFGSNGHNNLNCRETYKSIVNTFTKRINYDKQNGFQGVILRDTNIKSSLTKCIVKSTSLLEFGIHSHKTKMLRYTTSCTYETRIWQDAFAEINENILRNSCLHLNHYAIQSLEWFLKVKKTRGCVNNENVDRDETYFREYDEVSNDINDFEIYNINSSTL